MPKFMQGSRQSLLRRGLPSRLFLRHSSPQRMDEGASVKSSGAPARSRSVGHMLIQRSTMSVDELLGQGILFSNPDSPVIRFFFGRGGGGEGGDG